MISAGKAISVSSKKAKTTCTSAARDRKSTRLNSSHLGISYAVFCLKKQKGRERSVGSVDDRRDGVGVHTGRCDGGVRMNNRGDLPQGRIRALGRLLVDWIGQCTNVR